MVEGAVVKELTIADIARVCHEAVRALQMVTGDPRPSARWEETGDHASSLRSVRLLLGAADPTALHADWVLAMLADGWVHGEEKNPAAKTHPCLVPFSELPWEQQAKDYLYSDIVRRLAPYLSKAEREAADCGESR